MGDCKISPTYFLDEMDSDECNAIIESHNRDYKNKWEQTRYIAFVIAACNSDKIRTPKDLLKFDWEIEEKITKEERIAKEQEMLQWLKQGDINSKPFEYL